MSSNHYLDVSEVCVLFRAIGKNEIKLFAVETASSLLITVSRNSNDGHPYLRVF